MVVITRKRKRNEEESDPEFIPETEEDEEEDEEIILGEEDTSDEDYEEEEDYKEEEIEALKRLEKEDPEAYREFLKIRKFLTELEPKVADILKADLPLEDKAKLLEKWECMKDGSLDQGEFIVARDRFIEQYKKLIKNYKNIDPQEREKLKKIEEDLESHKPLPGLKTQILKLDADFENKAIIYNKYRELEKMDHDEEYIKLKTWLKKAISLPHNKIKSYPFKSREEITQFMQQVSQQLDEQLYGMKNVKEQIELFVLSRIEQPGMKGCSLCLVGPPGTGKTLISRCLAKILKLPFQQISCGGMKDPSFLKGQDYTYIGAHPGEIARSLSRMGYKNGILFFDEYDKISDNKEIATSLLHITDPEQNSEFRDVYFSDIIIDLSSIWFIESANKAPEDPALRDRTWIIKVPGYNFKEKVRIARDYILPRTLKNIGKDAECVILLDKVAESLIQRVSKTNEKGMRTIKNAIKDIVNKINFLILNQDSEGKLINLPHIEFNLPYKVSYPVTLTNDMINILSKQADNALPYIF
jgi:ATP-dependent Lon protease